VGRKREKKRKEGKRREAEKAQIIHQIQSDNVVADAA